MLFQHLGFVHCPIREHCPAFPNCMDALIVRILATKAHRYVHIYQKTIRLIEHLHIIICRPSSWNRSTQWLLSSDNNQLNLVILGKNKMAEDFAAKIRVSIFKQLKISLRSKLREKIC